MSTGDLSGARRPELNIGEVEGVPTVWMDAPGPYTGGLILRVGCVDETLQQRGITHMLEHLALHGLDRSGDHSNGRVDGSTLTLHVTASPPEVAEFLTRASSQLAVPPTHRLEDERGVLRAERASRPRHPQAELLAWRWGAASFALEGTPEYGLAQVDAEDLQDWANEYACRQNAVLWFTGPPPAGLRIGLHEGVRHRLPDPYASPLPGLPAYFRGSSDAVMLHGLVPRSTAAVALSAVLRSRLVEDLRTTRAAAYSPDVSYRAVTGDVGSLTAVSDIVQGRATEVTNRVMATLGELTLPSGAPRPEEIDAHRQRARSRLDAPTSGIDSILSAAWNLVQGAPVKTVDEALGELDALTPDGVARAARDLARTLLVQVPGAVEVPAPWVPAPVSPAPPLSFARRVFSERGGYARLMVGDDGVTLKTEATTLTVRYENLAGVAEWDDGGRIVIGTDGVHVVVEPALWRGGRQAVRLIDESTPWDKVLPLGDRPPGAAPRPPSFWASLRRERWALVVIPVLLVWGVLGIGASLHPDAGLAGPALAMSALVAASWFGALLWRLKQHTDR